MMHAAGLLRKEIAFELGLAPKTVNAHLDVAHLRLGVHSRRELQEALSALPASTDPAEKREPKP